MKNYNYKGLVKQSFSYLVRALNSDKNLGEIKKDIRALVNSYEGLNRPERYELYKAIFDTVRACYFSDDRNKALSYRKNYDKILGASRRVYASQRLRVKSGIVRAQLSSSGGAIFFLCSSHNAPAEDHKDYQGKIYVDRFWRQKVSGSEYAAVLEYIKSNDVMTVQEVMGGPVWLTTRPYCKHFFIPVSTEEVIGTVLSELVSDYHSKHRTDLYDDDDYYELRSKVYSKLNGIYPCKYYEQKIREK